MPILNPTSLKAQGNWRVVKPSVGQASTDDKYVKAPDGRIINKNQSRKPSKLESTSATLWTPKATAAPATSAPIKIKNWDAWKPAFDDIKMVHGIDYHSQAELEASMSDKMTRGDDGEWLYRIRHKDTNSKLFVTLAKDPAASSSQRAFLLLACAHLSPRRSTIATRATLAHDRRTDCGPWRSLPRRGETMHCCDSLCDDVPSQGPLSRHDIRLKQLKKEQDLLRQRVPTHARTACGDAKARRQPKDEVGDSQRPGTLPAKVKTQSMAVGPHQAHTHAKALDVDHRRDKQLPKPSAEEKKKQLRSKRDREPSGSNSNRSEDRDLHRCYEALRRENKELQKKVGDLEKRLDRVEEDVKKAKVDAGGAFELAAWAVAGTIEVGTKRSSPGEEDGDGNDVREGSVGGQGRRFKRSRSI